MATLEKREACLTNEVTELLKQNANLLEIERESRTEANNLRRKLE